MPFNKEIATKYGHQTKRGKSDTVRRIRGIYTDLIEGNLEQIQSDLDQMKPIDRVKAIILLSKFVLPQLKAVELKTDQDNPIVPVINFTSSI